MKFYNKSNLHSKSLLTLKLISIPSKDNKIDYNFFKKKSKILLTNRIFLE